MIDEIKVGRNTKQEPRELKLQVGMEYVVNPTNPRKIKNRGRKCVILDFVPVSKSHPHDIVAKIRYLDNNRVGRAQVNELDPI